MTKANLSIENGQQFLALWRKSRNLTQEQLAERMENTISTISGWETGRRTMDMQDLHLLARVYGVHPAALLMDPRVSDGQLSRMQEAADIVLKLAVSEADHWLAVGKKMTVQP